MSSEENAGAALPAAEVLNLAEMVQYADGSIVSRTPVDTDVGTITLFAFDAGQGLSEHSAPYDALVQVLDGSGEFKVGDQTCTVKAGEALVMPADVPHAVKALERFKMLLTMIRA